LLYSIPYIDFANNLPVLQVNHSQAELPNISA
jgi:hypothetical protein